ncbi:hypothetical protein ABG768_017717 [Culter alburnus]|uniref:CARD domain-containing protein n=1 Tax=Culter alburnus TaxID=194366 RepID=A0AAW1YT09_CULAL
MLHVLCRNTLKYKNQNSFVHPQQSHPCCLSHVNDTSAVERSEEEEAREEEEEKESDSDTRSRAEKPGSEQLQLCCEKCRALKNPKYELVTPRKMSRDHLQLQLDAEGVYECSDTALVFEVSQRVKITYCILSWSKFSTYLTGSWKFAGPIFDVDCDPSILKSIQFPHSLCLAADKDNEVKFSVLHVKNSCGLIEPSTDHSRSHVKWTVSSLSPVGPIAQTSKSAKHHGVVQVYKEVGHESSFSFRVYLARNNCSDMKDIRTAIRRANNCKNNKKYILVDKPPTCMLEENRNYRLISEPVGHITPEDMLFTSDILEVKGYFEVFFKESPPFKLSLTNADSGHTVWTVTIREGDCVHHQEETPRKPMKALTPSGTSTPEYSTCKLSCADPTLTRLIVSSGMAIADGLRAKRMIPDEMYSKVKAAETRQEKTRLLFDVLDSQGSSVKAEFYRLLKKNEYYLVHDLELNSCPLVLYKNSGFLDKGS